jgi:class 3 adenylate cyclase/predicted ATPase
MRCPSCQHDAADQARFCEHCGTRLTTACDACGAPVSLTARFCAACGTATAAAAPAAPGATDPAERRQVTVMFCDVVDSTGLSGRVDPEEFRDLMRGYYEVCAREIARVGGYIAQYRGDGVLTYFGYPVAREQDAQAAVLASLAIVQEMRRRSAGEGAATLSVRIGIHTGLVVAGEVVAADKRELFVVGSTPNVAARVEAAARPDSVVISDETYRLVRAFFDCVDLGEHRLKGVAAPVRLWEVRGETGAQSRIETPGVKLTPLVGREREMETLLGCWERVTAGEGMTILVSGDAGLGKSRLLHELKTRLAGQPYLRLECRCSPHNESSTLFPVIDLLQRLWRLRRADSVAERVSRLEAAVADYIPDVPDAVSSLAALLSITLPARYPALNLTPQARKKRTLEVLVALVVRIAARQPVLFAMEDLHWIDPSSLELLSRIVEELPAARILALFLFRPTFAPPWAAGDRVRRIDLARLAPEETAIMIERVAGGRALPPEVVRELRDRVDGVPLYVEELTKMVLESGALRQRDGRYELVRPLSALAVPTSLHDSLMARLDRLAPARGVLQLGATIGRAFSRELIRAVSDFDDATVDVELARLVAADILHQRGTPPATTYLFKHALIQDAAYESLLKNRRREYHLRIAETLERRFPEIAETQPELLGHHWAGANRAAEAIDYLLRAGRLAFERSAYAEAADNLNRGRALLPGVADADARERTELELLLALGPVLVGIRGYSNPEVETVYARARELCDRVGSDERLRFAVLSGLLLFHQSRAELVVCNELSRQRLALARQIADSSLEMLVHENLGTVAYWRGEFPNALACLREASSRYTPEGGRAVRLLYGTDTAVVCATYEAQVLFFLGFPHQALRKAGESLAIARALGHVHSLVLALLFDGILHRLRGELSDAHVLLDEAQRLADEQQLAQWIGSCAAVRADLMVASGQVEEGIREFLAGLAAFQATGATIAGRYFAAMLAEAYLAAQQPAEGLAVLDSFLEGLAHCEDILWDPEVLRTRGRLLVASSPDDPGPAEACFLQALELAHRFSARSLELRAATSLADLWGRLERRAQARRVLGDVYGWFTEGFETRDLKAAGALLSSLASQEPAAGLTARTST